MSQVKPKFGVGDLVYIPASDDHDHYFLILESGAPHWARDSSLEVYYLTMDLSDPNDIAWEKERWLELVCAANA